MSLTVIIPIIVVVISFGLAYRSLKSRLSTSDNSLSTYKNVILEIKVPKEFDEKHVDLQTAPISSEHMFASLHGLLKITPEEQEHFSFEMVSSPDGIKFYAAIPETIKSFVESQIYAQYPHAVISDAVDYTHKIDKSTQSIVVAEIGLSRPDFYPIKTFKDFEVDPISAVTSALSEVRGQEQVWMQLLVKPVPDIWQSEGAAYVRLVRDGLSTKSGNIAETFMKEISELVSLTIKRIMTPPPDPALAARMSSSSSAAPRLTPGQEIEIKAIDNKLTKMGFESAIRIIAVAPTKEIAESRLRSIIASMKQFSSSNLNSFAIIGGYKQGDDYYEAYRKRAFPNGQTYILNIEELASIYHLPSSTVETPAIAWAQAKKGEPPLNLPQENCTFFGVTSYRNKQIKFGLKDEDRRRHMYVIGKTGSGKSQLFRNMIIQDMRNGKGVGVLDPHGTLIDELLEMIPEERIKDVVYFDPSDEERPVALNMLEVIDQNQKNLMASGIVSAIKQHFGYSWGPRLEYLLNICVLTLLEVEGTTLLGITRLLTDQNYQKFITHQIKDPVLKEFWEKEYNAMKNNPKLVTEAVAPIQNKIGRFLSSSTIRNILGRPKSTVRLDEIMNGKKILLMNLSKGKIGDDNANLLGSLMVSRIQFVALQRAKIPEKDRVDFNFFVDEFQNFAAGSFESILSEARKYRLCLHLTHQYTSQVPEEILNAVFGNVGTMISFAIGAPDGEVLGREFAPVFTPNDLISLERQHMYLKLLVDGQSTKPFSAISMQRIEGETGMGKAAIEASRSTYGQDKAYVEEKIRLWVERKFDLGMAIAEEIRAKQALNPVNDLVVKNEVKVEPAANPRPNTDVKTAGEFTISRKE